MLFMLWMMVMMGINTILANITYILDEEDVDHDHDLHRHHQRM
jgi:hypothetical protein